MFAISDVIRKIRGRLLRYADAAEHAAKTAVKIHTLRPSALSARLLARRHHGQQLLDAGDQRDCRQLSRV